MSIALARSGTRRDRGLARDRRPGPRASPQARVRGSRPLSRGRAGRPRPCRNGVLCDRAAAADDGAAARAPRPAVPRARGLAVGVLPDSARRDRRGRLAVLGRLFPVGRRHGARPDLLRVPRVSRGDGARAGRRRRVPVHGRLGIDGARVLLPRHDRPPDSRDPPRGLPLPPDRACRSDRDPALLRRPAGWQRRLHVRRHALDGAAGRLAQHRVLPGTRRLRCEGRAPSASRVAAGSAPRGALARLRSHERRHAEDRDLRAPARHVRSPERPALVVGRDRARARARDSALRRHLRGGADRHEAAARVLVDREHRPHRRRASGSRSCSRRTARRCSRRSRSRRRSTTASTTRSSRACCSSPPARCCTRRRSGASASSAG